MLLLLLYVVPLPRSVNFHPALHFSPSDSLVLSEFRATYLSKLSNLSTSLNFLNLLSLSFFWTFYVSKLSIILKIYWPFSQRLPWYPERQLQVNLCWPSMHDPPFKHGLLAHSFTSTVEKTEMKWNGDVICGVTRPSDGIAIGPSSEPFREGPPLFFGKERLAIFRAMNFFTS